MVFYPELLRFESGRPVASAKDWPARRVEILNILAKEEYGFLPPVYAPGTGKVVNSAEKCCSGHAVLESVEITVQTDRGPFTFPMHAFVPTRVKETPCPLFLLVNFRPDIYDMYYPTEEIVDNGFILAVLNYSDVTSDDGNMQDGLCGLFDRPEDGTGFGKITLWAWAASRALDYWFTRPEVDKAHTAVIGHSRLGKTALWCGANDERFRYVFSNDSGCAGAAYEREKHEGAEKIDDIAARFPYWFCENYQRYVGKPQALPFDQHELLALIAPRYLSVHSASRDQWADPVSEQLSCTAASPVWELLGETGFMGNDAPFVPEQNEDGGHIAYYLRDGIHFLGRGDWLRAMEFIKKHW